MKKNQLMAMLSIVGVLAVAGTASAQVAGSTNTVGITVTEASQIALGWSVEKSILGKAIYNDAGEKIGKVVDMIIAPDKSVSYLIIGAGGFVGVGRHDVAIPIAQVQDEGGKFVLPGATKDAVKAMPKFEYASDTAKRDQFVAQADQDLAKAKDKVAEIQKKSAAVTGDAKEKFNQKLAVVQQDLKAAEDKLAQMKRASEKKWAEFENDVSKAIARVKRSIENATA